MTRRLPWGRAAVLGLGPNPSGLPPHSRHRAPAEPSPAVGDQACWAGGL